MKINFDSPDEEVRIELIPLIDVIFCILTFFLLAALQLTRQQAINVDLPQAETGSAQMREMLIVSVDRFGQTYIDDQPRDRQELSQWLRAYKKARPDGLLVLYASKMASYNDVVQVLDLLREVGGDRVALATIPSSGEIPENPNPDSLNPLGLPPSPENLQLPDPPAESEGGGDATTPEADLLPNN
ncbi:ExbD/TolR family protein [Oxynema aestuarii]|uniref:Biopolymer transporter ExbD n=1 Tax=Oxynema aestuarii AP17 TaxID=2064643 RepID=A0A6H1TYU6_9CYAN|nr:biopolymer transporter ExbD [Oxynema aestuarii]QIZ71788.1 biopolymer transporter ExbD [Oxynema aestuarii AP17]